MTSATRATAATLALSVALALAGCARAPQPGPQEPVPVRAANLLDANLLARALGPTGDTLTWSPVASSGDQTPAPCGMSSSAPAADSVETWRRGPLLAQVRLIPAQSPADARARANSLAGAIRSCPTWVETGAELRSRIVAPADPAGGPAATVAALVSRYDATGHTESAWVIAPAGSRVLSITVQASGLTDLDTEPRAGTAATSGTSRQLDATALSLLAPVRDRATSRSR